MLDPKICSRCEYAQIELPTYNPKTGDKTSLWTVDCYVVPASPYVLLMANSKTPKECPFILEHLITMKQVPKEDMDYLTKI